MNLSQLGTALGLAAVEMERAQSEAMKEVCETLLTSCREAIGNDAYIFGWPRLAEATIEKKGFERPLYEKGELQESYGYNMDADGREAYVGSDNPKAVWHEWGTGGPHPVPPRPVLGGALDQKGKSVSRKSPRSSAKPSCQGCDI